MLTATLSAAEAARLFGFPTSFASTQGKHVDDPRANAHGMRVKSRRKYRQYMNRRGGFNRPLDDVY